MRNLPVLALSFLLSSLVGCAGVPVRDGKLDVYTSTHGTSLPGAECVVRTGAGQWTVLTPAAVAVGKPAGDLHVTCNMPGYRTSEVIYRSDGHRGGRTRVAVGGGRGVGIGSGLGVSIGFGLPLGGDPGDYPSEIVVDMSPQP